MPRKEHFIYHILLYNHDIFFFGYKYVLVYHIVYADTIFVKFSKIHLFQFDTRSYFFLSSLMKTIALLAMQYLVLN